MNVKEFENARWTRDDQKAFFRHKAAFALVEPGSTVLDLGCGDGLMLSMLKDKQVTGKGIDLSEKGIEKAKTKGLDVSVFDFGSGSRLPFDDGSFDTVISLDVLEHLYDPTVVLKEAARVARKSVVIGVPNFSSLPARLQTLLGQVPENNRPHKGHIFWFNYGVLRKMAGKAGLTWDKLMVNTMFSRLPLIGWVMNKVSSIWPAAFALSFVVRLKK